MYHNLQQNQAQPKQKNLKDLNEIKQLKTNSRLKAINLILGECLYFNNNYYESESTIAKRLNIGASTVYRAVRDACDLGLITKRRRFNSSNVYAINPELRNPTIIDELASILPALRGILCLLMLIPLTALCKPASNGASLSIDQLNKKNEILRICSLVQRETMNKEKNKNLKRDGQSSKMNGSTYGGSGLYDRKSSQAEIDLQKSIHERQKRKYSMIYQPDDEAQPTYNAPKVSAARQQAYPVNTPYAPYEHKERQPEDPVQASTRLIEWTESEQFKKAEKLMGREVALKMCNKIVSQAIEESKE